MAEAASLIEKYQGAESANQSSSVEFRQSILNFKPEWDKYAPTKSHSSLLKFVNLGESALSTRKVLEQENFALAQACLDTLALGDEKLSHWILTLFYDMLREDSSTFGLFEDGHIGDKPLLDFLGKAKTDAYGADKAAWLISAVIGHVPGKFVEADVTSFLGLLLPGSAGAGLACTDLGILEAITNLLKSDTFRNAVWSAPGVAERVFKINPRTDSQPYLYRCVFAIWMLSFDKQISTQLKKHDAIQKMKGILINSRTEKVVRLSLTVLKNFLTIKSVCEEIVEEGLLEAVQQLEYEKWRDTELYDEIRDTSQLISTEVQEMSNFDRYERELQTGKLAWGFVHTSKFWTENVNKFETNDFRAIKHLATLLMDFRTDATTLAVCCHDIGEFVTLHPLGKRKVAALQVKERVMNLMSSTDAENREVRREALLCCQKIMLNKWNEIDTK